MDTATSDVFAASSVELPASDASMLLYGGGDDATLDDPLAFIGNGGRTTVICGTVVPDVVRCCGGAGSSVLDMAT